MTRYRRRVLAGIAAAAFVVALTPAVPAVAVAQPGSVSVAGSHNSEMGCAGDWQPDCPQAQLHLDPADGIWKGTFDVAAGAYEYKAALNGTWDENYGAGGAPGGANIAYTSTGTVSFYYDHASHWVTSDAEGPIVTAAGSFTSELGCPGDWAPDCMRSWLQDPDGDGVYTFSTTAIPAGQYEVKAAHGLSWAENYGAGGARDGANIPFTVTADGDRTSFSYELATHVLTVSGGVAPPDLRSARAHWLRHDVVALEPPAGAETFRLYHAPEGGLVAGGDGVTGGEALPLTLDPAGLPAELKARYPHLASYAALRLGAADVAGLLTGQLAVAAYDAGGRLLDATGVQVPGVLDDVYAGAARSSLGPVWSRGNPSLGLWAPTAKEVALLLDPAGPAGSGGSRRPATPTACGTRAATGPGATRATPSRSACTCRRSTRWSPTW